MGAASGKLDALVFIGGMVLGIWVFAEVYTSIYDFVWSGSLGVVTLPQLFGLSFWSVAGLAVLMALGLFRVARIAERKFADRS